jgi:hypothetical protein
MNRFLLSIALSLLGISGYSEDDGSIRPPRYGYFQFLMHAGTTWSRTAYLDETFDSGFRGYEMRFGFQTSGRNNWEQLHHYPAYGIGINYADLVLDRSDTILGNPFSGFMFFSAPWIRFGRITLNSDISVGLSYTSMVYDPVHNPYNDVIASHINLYFNYNLNLRFILSSRFDIHAGYGLTHYSNGAIKSPQKGVNNWGLNMGLSYHFRYPGQRQEEPVNVGTRDVRPDLLHFELPDTLPRDEIQLMASVGIVDRQDLGEEEGKYYFTSSFTVDYAVPYSLKNRVTFGLDVLYDGSLEIGIKGIPPEEVTTYQKMYLGSQMGYQVLIDRVTLMFNLGTYFVQHSYDRGFWFMRAGGRIRISEHLYSHLCIKTKAGIRSDWIEWGMACYLPVR